MKSKKSWAKMISSFLAMSVTVSSLGSVSVTAYAQAENTPIAAYAAHYVTDQNGQEKGLTNFTNIGEAGCQIDENNGTVTLDKIQDGDHFAVYDGLQDKANDFVLEADVKLLDDGVSAALAFGMDSKEAPGTDPNKWYGANVNALDKNFRIFGVRAEMTENKKDNVEIDKAKTLHLKLDVKKNGDYTYTFGDKGEELESLSGNIPNWQGGYVGILTWNSKAEFSNISFTDRTIPVGMKEISTSGAYKTNLEQLSVMEDADWQVTEEGLYSNAVGKGDSFLYSRTKGNNFVYSTDITFKQEKGAAALMFRNSDERNNKNCYVVNLNAENKKCRLWKWQEGEVYDLINETEVPAAENNKYILKVVACDSWISYYVNDTLVASTGDHTMWDVDGDKGQGTCINEGYFGLLNWDGEMVFQNTYYRAFDEGTQPVLDDISITASAGDIEAKPQFFPTEPTMIRYVKNNVSAVNVTATPKNSKAIVTVSKDGKIYEKGVNIPVEVGSNYITVKSSVIIDGAEAAVNYRVNVHRRQADEIYYNEPYRGQYHYSVKDGWGNDPNGMIYYKGKYHFFYQFYDDTSWGPMHWGHSVSTDMIHWEEKPIALCPDANGAMFNGCIVADTENTSGLFDDVEGGGLVALITANGNGQRLELAYSTDEGTTWVKTGRIVADWFLDPLHNRDFRDPKVFRWEGKWFLVIAGGPLRIYSSENLLDWKYESGYSELHMECPDLYPLKAEDGTLKWVLSGGGRYYKIGDFKVVDGSWKFIPDEAYNSYKSSESQYNGVMNFGKDSYAAMTYYMQDFGTSQNPTLPEELVEINWMNTWDYCRIVADTVGQKFNATYNLSLKLGIKEENGKYVLTQTPIQKYEELRDTENKLEWKNQTVDADNILLKDFEGDCYEIVSTFKPAADTKKVGFKLRTGNNQETSVIYDLENEALSIDRSKSGIIINGSFKAVDSQYVTKNADGSIDLHIYVDRSSVEVFTKGDTVTGANQIFPDITSKGASVFVEGGAAKADIAIYPMKTIWTDKVTVTESTKPSEIASSAAANSNINIGDDLDLSVSLLPVGVKQEIEWTVDGEEIVSVQQDEKNKNMLHVKGLKKGVAKITAKAKENPTLVKEFTINVFENNFETNIGPFTANGNWFISDEILSVSNIASNDSYMANNKIAFQEYVLETNLKYQKGLVNIFFASESTDPSGAYAVQLKDNDEIRLFRFGRDGDIKVANMGKTINDNQFHHVKIEKTKNGVKVSVDGIEYLTHTFDNVDDYYNNAFVGLGLWDGALEVKGINVTEIGAEIPAKVDAKEPIISENPAGGTYELGAKAFLKVTAESEDDGILSYQWYSNVKNSTEEAKEISGATEASYDIPTNEAGTTYYFCKVTNTNNSATGVKTASAASQIAEVVVKEVKEEKVDAKAPSVSKNPVGKTYVYKDKAVLQVTAKSTDGGTLSYQWYSNTKNSVSGAKVISKAIKASYTVPTSKIGTTYYFCKVTNTNSKATGNKTASADSKIAKIVVQKAVNPITKISKYSKAIRSKVTLKPQGTATYTSANKKVAAVNKKGVVTFKGFGRTTITVKAKGNAYYKAATKKITIEVVPKTVKLSSLKSAKSKSAIVKWKKDAKVTGYKIQYATNRKFTGAKNIIVKKNRTTSITLKKLKGGKKYYVRICSYKKVDKKTTVYSSWSKAKSVKVKK